jgi:site-specific DNA-methyltransferase (adenine-specific)
MSTIRLLKGDCLQKLKELEDNSIDSVVTDPPYGIGFMNKEWDSPKKHRELIEREQKRSEERHKEGKSPAKGTFTKGVQPGLPIGGAKEGRWFQEWSEEWAKEAYRVLKPGGYILSFCAPRMYHRMTSGIEDAGFEIRDQLMWVFGSGFPKSHNIGKAIDKIEGNEREIVGVSKNDRPNSQVKGGRGFDSAFNSGQEHQPIIETKGTSQWEGWGTALKPAHEPIVMARKPFKGTVADNVLEWGTGGINVDGCRIGYEDTPNPATNPKYRHEQNYKMPEKGQESKGAVSFSSSNNDVNVEGRFPANIIFECTCDTTHTKPAPKSGHWPKGKVKGFGEFGGGESSYEGVGPKEEGDMVIHTDPNCPCYILDQQSGNIKGGKNMPPFQGKPQNDINFTSGVKEINRIGYNDNGGASRFFYCPKASKKDRNEGCDDLENAVGDYTNIASKRLKCNTCGKWGIATDHCKCEEPDWIQPETKNIHPTVKPTDLMAYLVRLVTPKGGVVLDPFMGSGSTGKACVREGMNFIGIEREEEYMEIAKTRIEHEQKKNKHTLFFDI